MDGCIFTIPGFVFVILIIWYGNGYIPSLSNTLNPYPKSDIFKQIKPNVHVQIIPFEYF